MAWISLGLISTSKEQFCILHKASARQSTSLMSALLPLIWNLQSLQWESTRWWMWVTMWVKNLLPCKMWKSAHFLNSYSGLPSLPHPKKARGIHTQWNQVTLVIKEMKIKRYFLLVGWPLRYSLKHSFRKKPIFTWRDHICWCCSKPDGENQDLSDFIGLRQDGARPFNASQVLLMFSCVVRCTTFWGSKSNL